MQTISESEKRTLITKFIGAAWESIFSREDFSADLNFKKTGCLLTLDGSEDAKVNIEGMPDYKPTYIHTDDDQSDSEEALPSAAEEPASDIESENDSELDVLMKAQMLQRKILT